MCPTEQGKSFGLNWRIDRQHGLVTVALSGEMDLASADAITKVASELSAEGSVLVFDLGELEFMDSTGIRLLGTLKQSADQDGRRFLIGRISGPVRRVLHVAGLLSFFEYVEGTPPDELLCSSCDRWVPATSVRCVHCGVAL